MNQQDIDRRMEERWNRRGVNADRGRRWIGLFLVVIGALFLARQSGVYFPSWLFSWPLLLICIGLFIGIRHGFRGFGWLVPIAIGGLFLADRLSPDINLRPYIWPIVLIGLGVLIIFRPRNRHCFHKDEPVENSFGQEAMAASGERGKDQAEEPKDRNDIIDLTAIFGGVKKNVLSKTFKGGDIVAFMGGAEINLTQADFNGRVTIDCFNMFGGTKLIIPPDWEVQSEVVAIFGGVDDKRPPAPTPNPGKVLYLDGTCLFGGLEIKSY